MKESTRVLGFSDREHIINSFQFWNRDWLSPVHPWLVEESIAELDHYLDPTNSQFVMIGHFVEDQLVADQQLFFWNLKPHVTSEYIRTYKKPGFELKESTRAATINMALQISTQRNCFRYYYVIPSQWKKGLNRFHAEYVPESRHWSDHLEAHIPAYTRPESNFHWRIIGEEMMPVDCEIYFKQRKN